MRTLAFINLKGGTGKTISAANVAHILATVHHKKVLLVDGDKQGSVSQYFQVYGEHDGTAALLLADALDAESVERVIYQTGYLRHGERTHIYYCHPYSAFERGSNENGNRMIRRKVPKGTDFTGITEEDTLQVQRWVNEYPRGILGGRCAGRVLMELAQEAGVKGVELLL